MSARQAAARPTFWPSWWAVDKVVSPAGLPVEAAATDNLAKLLDKKKHSFNKPWYDGLKS